MIGRQRSGWLAVFGVGAATLAACAAPIGGAASQVAPTAAPLEGAPASGRVAPAIPTPTTPLAPVQPAATSVGPQPVATSAPAAAMQPLPPDTTAVSAAAPPVPTLIPNAAIAATANAATAVARSQSQMATATAVPSQQIAIQNFAFSPATIAVPVGSMVTWTNADAAAHHVAGADFDSGVIVSGHYWAMQFQRPGTYDYLCSIHPTMRGQIVVTEPSSAQQFSS